MPMPDSDDVGLPPGFALTVRVAVFMPGGATGVKVTTSVHIPPVIRVFPLQVSLLAVIANSEEPVMPVVIVPVVAPPVFMTVKDWPALCVPCGTELNDAVVGMIVSKAGVT